MPGNVHPVARSQGYPGSANSCIEAIGAELPAAKGDVGGIDGQRTGCPAQSGTYFGAGSNVCKRVAQHDMIGIQRKITGLCGQRDRLQQANPGSIDRQIAVVIGAGAEVDDIGRAIGQRRGQTELGLDLGPEGQAADPQRIT